ncbi:hypothetical protein JSE7799_00324 [Jannaschia seosinensis]|uniref:Uncharacterized protein n=1 Tax=Jannaschia seosinensis TaxID=313367 RepID=A0A0M7B604_9RHOB|nr:hypothetical protein [Jannaschia seosinensis]CUH15806.1 hypothetical protein JSE7799_00324 [Jannaschia seosinensis]
MSRLALCATFAALLATPTVAQGVFVPPPDAVMGGEVDRGLTGQRARLARELPHYGYGNVDVARLSERKVALIANSISAGRSFNYTSARIGSILRGGGLLQRAIDGL